MQLHIQIGRGEFQFLTDLVTGELQPLSHQKQSSLYGRQLRGAGLQHFKKLAAADVLLRVAPFRRRFLEVPVGLESNVIQGVTSIVVTQWRGAYLPAVVAHCVNHLVLEDAHQPGLELRTDAKRLRFGERRQQGFRNGIFRPGLLAQLQPRKTQQVDAVFKQLLFEGGHESKV